MLNIIEAKTYLKKSLTDIKKAVLFGSYATGENTSTSDIDLYIVTNEPELVRSKLAKYPKLQLLIKKPSETILFRKNNEVLFEQINKGVVIYQNEKDL